MGNISSVNPAPVAAPSKTKNSAGFEVQAFDNILGWRAESRPFATEALARKEMARQLKRESTATVKRRVYEALIHAPKAESAWARWFTFPAKAA